VGDLANVTLAGLDVPNTMVHRSGGGIPKKEESGRERSAEYTDEVG
jgi:hypothetical protein